MKCNYTNLLQLSRVSNLYMRYNFQYEYPVHHIGIELHQAEEYLHLKFAWQKYRHHKT